MTSVIYVITNIINDKQYVGQAVVKDKRWKNHKIALRTGKHTNKKFQSSYNKYGVEAFIYTLLEKVTDLAKLTEREDYWINKLNTVTPNGYNLMPASDSLVGFKHSEETKQRWSEQRKGQKRSAEFAASVSLRMTGKIVSDETRQRQSDSHKGNKHSPEVLALMSEQRKGNKFAAGSKRTKEHMDALLANNKGVPKTAEHKAKIAAGNRGKFVSDETRLKQSIAARNRKPRVKKPIDAI